MGQSATRREAWYHLLWCGPQSLVDRNQRFLFIFFFGLVLKVQYVEEKLDKFEGVFIPISTCLHSLSPCDRITSSSRTPKIYKLYKGKLSQIYMRYPCKTHPSLFLNILPALQLLPDLSIHLFHETLIFNFVPMPGGSQLEICD